MDNHDRQPLLPTRRAGWSRRILIGAAALAALTGVGTVMALSSDSGPGERMRWAIGAEFAEFRLERMLKSVAATPEQTENVKTIFASARDDLLPMATAMKGTREDAAKLLSAPTIDRAAAEALRRERVAMLDKTSQRMTAALLDIAEALSPEQRAELTKQMRERGFRRP